eukprot:COSAG01_NODE_1180_length_11360_cov_40.643460_15_plen_77_part_00
MYSYRYMHVRVRSTGLVHSCSRAPCALAAEPTFYLPDTRLAPPQDEADLRSAVPGSHSSLCSGPNVHACSAAQPAQ